MSRIGKKPIVVPDKVQVKIENSVLKAKGPKGELSMILPEEIAYTFENNVLTFSRSSEQKHVRAMHGLTRAHASNIIEGVNEGFTKTLLIEGVGYKVEMRGEKLLLAMGYSHPIVFIPNDGLKFETPNATTVKIHGSDKQVVGLAAAKIRAIRPPEPYKGKGIRYEGEYVRRKAGKTASK